MRPGTEPLVLAAALAFVTACGGGGDSDVEEDVTADELAACTAKVVGHTFERPGGAWDSMYIFMDGGGTHDNDFVELAFGANHTLGKARVITSSSYYVKEDYSASPPMIEYDTQSYDGATYRFWPSACNRKRVAIDLEPGVYGERLIYRHAVEQYGDSMTLSLQRCTPDPAYPHNIGRAKCAGGYVQYLDGE